MVGFLDDWDRAGSELFLHGFEGILAGGGLIVPLSGGTVQGLVFHQPS